MGYGRIAILTALSLAVLATAFAGRKKPDDDTQVLDLPKDPPMVAVGETSRLVFHTAPLSAKGLLSQQTREALRAILKTSGGAQPIHIRAFVAGSGDARRVPQIVSEVFTEKKLPLPSVSVVLAGALPLENAQIAIETVSVAKKEVNSAGLAFVEDQSPDRLASKLAGAAALRVTCFVGSLDGAGAIAAKFPGAAVDVVQTRRVPVIGETHCEAWARGGSVKAQRLAFTGTQVAFGADEKAAALAFQRLDKEVAGVGASASDIVATHVYAVSEGSGQLARKVWAAPETMTIIPVEGVASLDGSFAVDAIATVNK